MNTDVTTLKVSLESGSPAARLDAAEKLARLGDQAREAAVALVEACAASDEQLRDWAVAALEELGPPQSGDAPRLAELIKHESVDVAYWAATLLGRLQRDAAVAVPSLVAVLETHAELPVRERAAWALGQIGPAAGAARDALQQASRSADQRLARLAQEALARI